MANSNRPADMDSLKMNHSGHKRGVQPSRTSMSTVAKVSGGAVEAKGPKVPRRTPGKTGRA